MCCYNKMPEGNMKSILAMALCAFRAVLYEWKYHQLLVCLPSYFSGSALLVGHREENTNYKEKLIKIASKSGPSMNISLSPQMDGSFSLSYYYWTCQKQVFNSLHKTGQISILMRMKNFPKHKFLKNIVGLQQFRLLQKPSHNSMRQNGGLEGGELEACRLLNVVCSII